ncbi:MAG: hypothetical protein R3E31_19095 [Chloroflexota bacterium]
MAENEVALAQLRQDLTTIKFIGELYFAKTQFRALCQLTQAEASPAQVPRPHLIPAAMFVMLMLCDYLRLLLQKVLHLWQIDQYPERFIRIDNFCALKPADLIARFYLSNKTVQIGILST